jgi:hypothetical protein
MKNFFAHPLAALVILLSTVSLAQSINPSEAEELRSLKQNYRTFLIAQRQVANPTLTEAEEMRLIKQDYQTFLLEQHRTNHVQTEAEEMRLIKQDYQRFALEQRRNSTLLVSEPNN